MNKEAKQSRESDMDTPNTADEPRLIGRFIARDGGFTSVGVVVALMLVVALLFTAAQVRWMASTSADIQFVADAGALAAQNIVAEYEVIAQVADAVVLSMSLFGMTVFGIGIVVSCIPYTSAVGTKIVDFGRKVFDARDKVAKQAANALNVLQYALPFLCAINAARVITSNRISPHGTECYIGIAIPFPLTGEKVEFPSEDEARSKGEELEERNSRTAEISDEAQESYDRMQQSKYEGYMADCGQNPNYCLYERARGLGGLNGAQNPYFSSVETWEFSYALDRAKAYYRARLANESPASSKLEDQVRSFSRTRFYTFAVSEMAKAYAYLHADGTLDAYFPLMPRNTNEYRTTTLYTEKVYPVSADGVIHGSPVCPEYLDSRPAGYASVAQCEDGTYKGCEHCGFSINTIGRVAQASTSIDNGFEYHYRRVAEAAERYAQAAKEYRDASSGAKESAQEGFNLFKTALEALKTPRLYPHPPGRNGCIAIVIDPGTHPVPSPFASSFVAGGATLKPRIAISAAAMAADEASFGDNVIASFLDRVKDDFDLSSAGGLALGAFDGILEIWSSTLLVYNMGIDMMTRGLGDFLRAIPLVNSTPLASWAERTLRETFEAFGMQGASLATPKPVLVNSVYVALTSDSIPGRVLVSAKEAYASLPGSASGTIGASFIDGLLQEFENQGVQFLESEFTLFTITFGDIPGLPEIPIKVTLPDFLIDRGKRILSDTRSSLSLMLDWGGGSNALWD